VVDRWRAAAGATFSPGAACHPPRRSVSSAAFAPARPSCDRSWPG